MQRSMSYALDGALSTRNQGQLYSQAVVQNKTMRLPGLKEVPLKGSGTGNKLTRSRRDTYTPGMAGGCLGCGMGNITLPMLGEVSFRDLAIGGVLVAVGFYLLKRK